MRIPQIRGSLLWTFTGAFLIVLIGGIVLQSLLLAAVLRPALVYWRSTTRQAIAQTAATEVARAITAGEDVSAVLRGVGKTPGIVLVYRDQEGRVASSHDPATLPRWMLTPSRGHERARARHPVAVAPVVVGSELLGEIIVFPRFPDRPFRIEGAPRPWLLFLPIAAMVAGVAGFILFRSVAGRLAHLEDRFRRVEEGDLDARVSDRRLDEVGRLGQAFNSMASRLKASREDLIGADAQRRRFLADVTHDLATPLTTIRGYAETLLDPSVPKSREETDRYLRFIQEEAVRMDALVADLLDLARIEAGAVPLEMEEVDLAGIARREADRVRPAFTEAGLGLEGPLAAVDSMSMRADRRRLEQLVSNLLRNALQHVPAGGSACVRLELSRDGEALLIVEDDGPGFRTEDLPHVFERFYRGTPSRPSGGTGLGLAIVRGIARAHGGEAHAENRPEGGARVCVRFPRTPRS